MRNSFCFLLPILILALSHKLAQASSSFPQLSNSSTLTQNSSSLPQLSFANNAVAIPVLSFDIDNNAIGSPGANRFSQVMVGRFYDPESVLHKCAYFVAQYLYSAAHRPVIQNVKWIVWTFPLVPNQPQPIGAVKTDPTDGASLLLFNAGYVASLSRLTDEQVANEIVGVLYELMTGLYLTMSELDLPQPPGLLSGIGAYMRIIKNLKGLNWPPPGSGTFFDDGDSVTGYFLDFCAGLTNEFVSKLVHLMQDLPYTTNYFNMLVFQNVNDLWDQFKFKYGM